MCVLLFVCIWVCVQANAQLNQVMSISNVLAWLLLVCCYYYLYLGFSFWLPSLSLSLAGFLYCALPLRVCVFAIGRLHLMPFIMNRPISIYTYDSTSHLWLVLLDHIFKAFIWIKSDKLWPDTNIYGKKSKRETIFFDKSKTRNIHVFNLL